MNESKSVSRDASAVTVTPNSALGTQPTFIMFMWITEMSFPRFYSLIPALLSRLCSLGNCSEKLNSVARRHSTRGSVDHMPQRCSKEILEKLCNSFYSSIYKNDKVLCSDSQKPRLRCSTVELSNLTRLRHTVWLRLIEAVTSTYPGTLNLL